MSYDELRRTHVKHTLIDYKYNLVTQAKTLEHIDAIEFKLRGNVGAVRYDQEVTTGSAATSNWIISELDKKERAETELRRLNHQIHLVEKWLSCLDPYERYITKEYIINGSCKDAERYVHKLNFQSSRQLHRTVSKIITKIMNIV